MHVSKSDHTGNLTYSVVSAECIGTVAVCHWAQRHVQTPPAAPPQKQSSHNGRHSQIISKSPPKYDCRPAPSHASAFQTVQDQCVVANTSGPYGDDKCDSKCVVPPKYACDGATCKENSAGTFTTSDCDKKCAAPPPPPPPKKYSCDKATCKEDTAGSYGTSNCDEKCTAPPPTPPCELRSLRSTAGLMTPPFDPFVTNYTLSGDSQATELRISALPTADSATCAITLHDAGSSICTGRVGFDATGPTMRIPDCPGGMSSCLPPGASSRRAVTKSFC